MGYWKGLLVSFIFLSIVAVIAYGWSYLWYVIIWKDAVVTPFQWMFTFIWMLCIIFAFHESD